MSWQKDREQVVVSNKMNNICIHTCLLVRFEASYILLVSSEDAVFIIGKPHIKLARW